MSIQDNGVGHCPKCKSIEIGKLGGDNNTWQCDECGFSFAGKEILFGVDILIG